MLAKGPHLQAIDAMPIFGTQESAVDRHLIETVTLERQTVSTPE
jgi:hypothetical protein